MYPPHTLTQIQYRSNQFFAAVWAIFKGQTNHLITTDDIRFVQTILTTPAQYQLFTQMSSNDQRHALAVARTLYQAGFQNMALLQAGLLHDMAKSLGQPILYRVIIVILEMFWPSLLVKLSTPQNTLHLAKDDLSATLHTIPAWQRPFIIHAYHPKIGAIWANQANCDPIAINLINRHQDKLEIMLTTEDHLLYILQWADNLN